MTALFRSLSVRLGLGFALLGTLLMGIVGVYLYQSLLSEVALRDDQALLGRLERVQLLLQGSPDLDEPTNRPELYANMLGNTQHFLWVLDPDGRALVSINPTDLPRPRLDAAEQPRFHQDSDQTYRLVVQRIVVNQRPLTLIAGHLLAERQQMLGAYRVNLITALSVGSVLSFLLGFWLSQRGLRSLRQLAQQASAIDSDSLHQRLHTPTRYTELDALVGSFNQALARLEEGFEQLNRFSADLAHEMRTPLNNLIGQTQQSLSRPRLVEQYEQLLESNLEEFERLSRMIDSLLFLARSVQPQQRINTQSTDLAVLVDRLCAYFEGMAEDRQLQLVNSCSHSLDVEPEMLTRALANLLANAIRHADAGSKIRLTSQNDESEIRLSVFNHGPAIDAQHLPRLFERFYRADASRSQPGDTGGLGLAIVAAVMQRHGGRVSVSNEENGVRFTLHFPATVPT